MTDARLPALKFLQPGWYAIVMGLGGLSLAWHRAQALMGEMAGAAALVLGIVAALVFGVLLVATALRGYLHPAAWAEDRRHPVRHTFVATLPISMMLIATVAVALLGPQRWITPLWAAGCAAQLWVTLWVLGRWWLPPQGGGLQWAGVTPGLFIPIVGNVLVPLAGVPLGYWEWSLAQYGIGLLFWPVASVLLVVRLAMQGLWPERLLPSAFILIAPPAVGGIAALQLGAPPFVGWLLWGMALVSLLWPALLVRRIAALPFGMPHWGMSFPLTAMAAFTLRMAAPGGPMALLGLALLALATLVIAGLVLGTLRGLRNGTLLVAEPVAMMAPAATAGAAGTTPR